MKQYLLIANIVLFCSGVFANQPLNGITALKYGDHVPDIRIARIYNYKQTSARLSAFYQDKPLIIAFWGTTCGTCLKSLPKLDSLHKELQSGFNVLSVTEDDYAAVKKTLHNISVLKNVDLPYVTNDKIFSRYFVHRYLPHIVWINRKGIIAAITTEEYVTAESIKNFIADDTIQLFEKNDDMIFDVFKPYMPADSLIQFKSVLTRYNPGIRAAGYEEADRDGLGNIDSVKRVFMVNTIPTDLFYNAFIHLTNAGSYDAPLYNRIIFNVKDSAKYYYPDLITEPADINWKMKALYCYELTTAKLDRASFYKSMFDDLNRYFKIKGSIEKRMVPCYTIVHLSGSDTLLRPKGGKPTSMQAYDTESGKTRITIRSLPLSNLLRTLNRFSMNMPVTDDGVINELVDMDIYLSIRSHEWNVRYDPGELMSELRRYGLELAPSQMQTDVLILSEQ